MPAYDVAVIGGGIVGLATAMALLDKTPRLRLVLLEKEPAVALHQTSHNSGVIHSGIYYRPGSLRARTCVEGAKLLVAFCETHRIPYELCGKLIVATDQTEVPYLTTLYQRGMANGVPGLSMLGPEQIREREPHARGVRAIHVPSAGIVDYAQVARTYARLIEGQGGHIRTGCRVLRLRRRNSHWVLETTRGAVEASYVVSCAGLHADRVTRMAGGPRDLRITPFRGEYYDVVPARRSLVRSMIYPVPRPGLPFLGVHLTRSIDGTVHAGPNAVLALKREGYRKTDVNLRDVWSLVTYAGFWKMAHRHRAVGMSEWWRSLYKPAFVRSVRRLVPELGFADLVPGGRGVRAQALDPNGSMLDDFDIVESPQALHVRNVPSPAATASLLIGRLIADKALSAFAVAV